LQNFFFLKDLRNLKLYENYSAGIAVYLSIIKDLPLQSLSLLDDSQCEFLTFLSKADSVFSHSIQELNIPHAIPEPHLYSGFPSLTKLPFALSDTLEIQQIVNTFSNIQSLKFQDVEFDENISSDCLKTDLSQFNLFSKLHTLEFKNAHIDTPSLLAFLKTFAFQLRSLDFYWVKFSEDVNANAFSCCKNLQHLGFREVSELVITDAECAEMINDMKSLQLLHFSYCVYLPEYEKFLLHKEDKFKSQIFDTIMNHPMLQYHNFFYKLSDYY
jgi:hypothetical protein